MLVLVLVFVLMVVVMVVMGGSVRFTWCCTISVLMAMVVVLTAMIIVAICCPVGRVAVVVLPRCKCLLQLQSLLN